MPRKPAGRGSPPVYFRLPEDIFRRVERAAARAGFEREKPMTVPEWCRMAVERVLEEEEARAGEGSSAARARTGKHQ